MNRSRSRLNHHRARTPQILRDAVDRGPARTRISGWLGDDLDIQAVLSGLSGREALRDMLARLQPKEEVLLVGWCLPMSLPARRGVEAV